MKEYRLIQEKSGIREYELASNGLRVLLLENHSAPVATLMVTYNVGSRHETEAFRGGAHLLEHMMFKGTPRYQKAKGTQIASMLQELGAILNAGTWMDGTHYFELMPSDKLDIALNIEADRMRNSLFRKEDLISEMPVVQSEFDQLDNSPIAALQIAVWEKAFTTHPYHFPIIGTRRDLTEMKIENLRRFYDLYYWPDNATVIIIGDFKTDDMLGRIHNRFGKIPRSPNPVPPMTLVEPEQKEERFVGVLREDKLEAVMIVHKTPAATDPDILALDVLSHILASGKISRFYRGLVDRGIAADIQSEIAKTHDPGVFTTLVISSPGVKHQDLEKAVLAVYEKIRKDGVTSEEVARAQNQIYAAAAFSRDGSYSLANELSSAVAGGDWTLFATYLEKISNVTTEDILRVTNKYLVPEKMTVGHLVSKQPLPAQGNLHPFSLDLAGAPVTTSPVPMWQPTFGGESQSAPRSSKLSDRIKIKNVEGIKVISVANGIKDVVSISGSFEGAGYVYSENIMIPTLTVGMLDKGTQKHSKFEIAHELEDRGVELSFYLRHERVGFRARCLKKDIDLVTRLLAEQLRCPAFSQEEFEKQKQQQQVNLHEEMHNTTNQAYSTLARIIYPRSHAYYEPPYEEQLKQLESATLDQVREFHTKYYGPANMILVATGDVDAPIVEQSVSRAFAQWNVNPPAAKFTKKVPPTKTSVRETIPLADKTKVDVVMGHALPLDRQHPEYLPVYLTNVILGGNFSARLSNTVRDEQGLTYHIHSELVGIGKDIEGHWQIQMISNKQSVDQGVDATLAQLRLFRDKGVTAEELQKKKNTVIGNFKVSMATTQGLAGQILRAEELGLGAEYLDNYPEEIQKVMLERANQAITDFFDPAKLHIIVCGSLQ